MDFQLTLQFLLFWLLTHYEPGQKVFADALGIHWELRNVLNTVCPLCGLVGASLLVDLGKNIKGLSASGFHARGMEAVTGAGSKRKRLVWSW